MGRGKKYQPKEVVHLLRAIETAVADGKTLDVACRDAGIIEDTYHRWRNEFRDLTVDQVKKLKELQQENVKLKRLVADLSLEKLLLKEIIAGNL